MSYPRVLRMASTKSSEANLSTRSFNTTMLVDDSLDDSMDSNESEGHVNRVFGDDKSDDSYLDEEMNVQPVQPSRSNSSLNANWTFDCTFTNLLGSYAFGSLKTYGPPLLIRFYTDSKGNPKAHIGDFRNVSYTPDDVNGAINCQGRFVRTTFLAIVFEGCKSFEVVLSYMTLLSSVLKPHFDNRDRPEFEKCVFSMDNYAYVNAVLGYLKEHLNRLFELNIGYPRDHRMCLERNLKDLFLETNQIRYILKEWLAPLTRTIRCLRVYESIALTDELAAMLNQCFRLTHLTISKVIEHDYKAPISVRSFEFDGQHLAFIDSDTQLFKYLPVYAPQCRHFSFIGVMYHPCINAFLSSRYLFGAPGQYNVYQPATDIANLVKILSSCYDVNEEVCRVPGISFERKRKIVADEVPEQKSEKCINLMALKNREVKLRIYKSGEQYMTQPA